MSGSKKTPKYKGQVTVIAPNAEDAGSIVSKAHAAHSRASAPYRRLSLVMGILAVLCTLGGFWLGYASEESVRFEWNKLAISGFGLGGVFAVGCVLLIFVSGWVDRAAKTDVTIRIEDDDPDKNSS